MYNEIPSLLRHGLRNVEKLNTVEFGVQVIFQLKSTTGDGQERKLSLQNLKEIELEYLPELEFLCNGPTQFLCLQNLTCLTLRGCHRLRCIFSTTLAENLLQLELLNERWPMGHASNGKIHACSCCVVPCPLCVSYRA